jgi:hypothetical protein
MADRETWQRRLLGNGNHVNSFVLAALFLLLPAYNLIRGDLSGGEIALTAVQLAAVVGLVITGFMQLRRVRRGLNQPPVSRPLAQESDPRSR